MAEQEFQRGTITDALYREYVKRLNGESSSTATTDATRTEVVDGRTPPPAATLAMHPATFVAATAESRTRSAPATL